MSTSLPPVAAMFSRLLRTATWLFWMLGAGLILLLILVVATIRSSLPQIEGQQALAGLSHSVSVQRDAQGSVTLVGGSRLDLARATGFVHAQDRYFQMDLSRRDAAGELSALFGAAAQDHDLQRRRHRMRERAQQVIAQAAADERALLAAYADGVNAGLQALSARPFEYLLLRQLPQAWRPEDSILVSYAMWFDLTDETAQLDAERALIEDALPPALAEFLFPSGSAWDTPLAGPTPSAAPLPSAEVLDLRAAARATRPMSPLEPQRADSIEMADLGSNSWAVSAAASASGGAMVANDMHLGLRVPHIWYRLRLRLADGGLDISGVSLPGLPLIVAGSNGRIAWGFTNSYGDWSDRLPLAQLPAPPPRLLRRQIDLGGGRVAAVLDSTLGPVIENPAFGGRREAMQWLAHDPRATNLRLAWLEQAGTVEEALAVAAEVGIPPQNFVVADAQGAIGWTVAGRLPRRHPDRPREFLRDAQGQLAFLPTEDYPQLINPPGGLLWTANSRVVTDQRLQLLGDGGYALGARARQIRDGLQARQPLDLADSLAVQLDDRALFLAPWQQLLMQMLTPEVEAQDWRYREARDFVARWGERAAVDSVGYRVVRAWREALRQRALRPLLTPVLQRQPDFDQARFAQTESALWQLLQQEPTHLLDPAYPDWQALKLAALAQVLDELAAQPGGLGLRTWGERNTLKMQHPLSRAVPWLSPWLDMAAVPLAGDSYLPRVQGPAFGASQRFTVSPGREAQGYLQMPGGASGHPWSPFYRSGHQDWVEGRPSPFLPGPVQAELQLTPAS